MSLPEKSDEKTIYPLGYKDEDYDDPNVDEALFLLALFLVVVVVLIFLLGSGILVVHFVVNGTPLEKLAALAFALFLGRVIYKYISF